MLHLYDRASMTRALTLDLDPRLNNLLARRIASLDTEHGDLTDWTEMVVVSPGTTEEEIVAAVGFSPLDDPMDGARFGAVGWEPGFDHIAAHDGYFEIITTFGSTFAYLIFVADEDGVPKSLLRMCHTYCDPSDHL